MAEIALSADDNYVAYTSPDPNAVPGLTNPNGYSAIYLWDRQTGQTVLVSHDAANDGQINGNSNDLSISSNGQYVTFVSSDPGSTGLTNGQTDVFEWNRLTGQVTLVDINAAGTGPGDSASATLSPPVMTSDGRYIAFDSSADDLVANATGTNVFLRDTVSGTTTLISVNAAGSGSGNSSSFGPSITTTGTAIAFISAATDLTADPITNPGNVYNIFVRTLGANPATTLVSFNAAGTASGNGTASGSMPPSSANGRYVAFFSNATDLVGGYVNGNAGNMDLYVRDLQEGLTRLVTVNQSGTAGADTDESSDNVQFSGDSSTLVFDSAATNLIAGDFNTLSNVFAEPTAGFSSISGQVFDAGNGNAGLQSWTVYLDANGNGKLDPGESTSSPTPRETTVSLAWPRALTRSPSSLRRASIKPRLPAPTPSPSRPTARRSPARTSASSSPCPTSPLRPLALRPRVPMSANRSLLPGPWPTTAAARPPAAGRTPSICRRLRS